MPRNHELFLTFLIKVALFAFPFIALELVFTRIASFGVATGCAAFLAALTGASLDHLLLRADSPRGASDLAPDPVFKEPVSKTQAEPPLSFDDGPAVEDVHSSALVEAYRVDLAQLQAQLARAETQIKSTEFENSELRLQLIESESKLLMDTEAPFPVSDDVLELGYHGAVDDFKRRLLTQSIVLTDGNRAEAARHLGLQRTYLYRLVKQFQVKT